MWEDTETNEQREDFNKLQSEPKETIKKEIYKIKNEAQNMKEFNKDMEKRIKHKPWK
jgi:hypothetical protein